MEILPEEQSKTLLDPYLDELQECMRTAWNYWEEGQRVLPRLWLPLKARTRASFIHDHICREVKDRFAERSNIWISEPRGFLQINFHDLLLARFKKFDKYLRTSNVDTRQQVLYGMQAPLPGIPDLTRVNIGYELDLFQTSIKDYWVTCPKGKALLWSFAFPRAAAKVTLIPSLVETPIAVPAQPRIRRKKTAEEKEAEQVQQESRETGDA